MRSLAGSHYALVERNNNIILAYSKKELIRLHTASQLTGYSGEKKSLKVSVTSSHTLASIDWSAPRSCWQQAAKSFRMVSRTIAWCCPPISSN